MALKNSAGLFLKDSLFERGFGLLRPAGLSFVHWRWTTRVSPRDHDQINSGLDYFFTKSLAELPAVSNFPVDSGIVISPLDVSPLPKTSTNMRSSTMGEYPGE